MLKYFNVIFNCFGDRTFSKFVLFSNKICRFLFLVSQAAMCSLIFHLFPHLHFISAQFVEVLMNTSREKKTLEKYPEYYICAFRLKTFSFVYISIRVRIQLKAFSCLFAIYLQSSFSLLFNVCFATIFFCVQFLVQIPDFFHSPLLAFAFCSISDLFRFFFISSSLMLKRFSLTNNYFISISLNETNTCWYVGFILDTRTHVP